MSNCPNCNKPVDTLRSRHVSVRDGKIVAYCSPECLAAAATQPVRAAVPKPAPALDSEPVIQILHEPASGVVTSAPDQRKSAPVEVPPPPADDAAAEEKEKDKPKTKAERKAAEKAERERRAKKLSEALKPLPKPAEVEAAPPAAAAKPAAAIVEDEAKPVSAAALAEAEAKPKKRRNRRDSIDAKGAWEWLDEEPAEPINPRRRDRDADGDTPRPGSRAMQLVLVLAILAILGVGGFFAYDRYLKKRADVPPAGDAAAALPRVTDVVAIDAGPPPPDPAQIQKRALESALGVLRTTLETSSPQMQELAALALSRTKDEKAIAFLADALPRSSTDTKRLEIAYALARAGDKRGRDALLAATKVTSRDTRLDAGKKLAQLGDKAAIAPLSYFIDTRFEVAKALAPLGESRAIKELERRRAKGKGDEKTLATIALVRAGKVEHVPEVRALLDDRNFRHDASIALAERQDAAARPVLLENVMVQSTQPEVPRALRLVDPAADLSAQLVQLEDRLASEKDTEQIKAADAILILAGPPEWVARP